MRRRVGFLFIICAAIPVAVFASTAWACGALTTLHANTSVAAPNAVIDMTGRNFGAGPQAAPPGEFSDVQIRLDSRSGRILASVPEGRSFTRSVRLPRDTPAGWHVVVATQFNTLTGVPKSGSPARTTIRVQGAPVPGATGAPWGGAAPTSGGPGSPDLPLPGILLSVALLATGLTLVFRDRGRKAARSALGA